MRTRGWVLLAALFVLFHIGGLWLSEEVHEWGQTSETAHEVVMALDLMSFVQSGGGFFGATHNYFGWVYQKEMLDHDRPTWHKVLFWPNPYYVTEPPGEWPWPYPPRST